MAPQFDSTLSFPPSVAILFSGGDSPGMNAFLRAFVRLGLNRHQQPIYAVKNGFSGLVRLSERSTALETTLDHVEIQISEKIGRAGVYDPRLDIILLRHSSVSGIIDSGGILLGASRCPAFHDKETRADVIKVLDELGVETLVIVGGDGSMRAARHLSDESDIRTIGIPSTIDNDVMQTDVSLGVSSAVDTVTSDVRRLNSTAEACHRLIVVQTMGGRSGYLAQMSALTSGAEFAVIPETGTFTQGRADTLAEAIRTSMSRGRLHSVVLVAEGVNVELPGDDAAQRQSPGPNIADYLRARFEKVEIHGAYQKVDVRHCVPGPLQRGGAPNSNDIFLASEFAQVAWDSIQGNSSKSGIVATRRNEVKLVDFDDDIEKERDRRFKQICRLQQEVSVSSMEIEETVETL